MSTTDPWIERNGQGLTLVHFSAQPEPFLTQNTPYIHHVNPCHPLYTSYTPPKCTPSPTESAYIEPESERV